MPAPSILRISAAPRQDSQAATVSSTCACPAGRVFLGVHNKQGEDACDEEGKVTPEGKRQVEAYVKHMLASEPEEIMDHMEISVQVMMTRWGC